MLDKLQYIVIGVRFVYRRYVYALFIEMMIPYRLSAPVIVEYGVADGVIIGVRLCSVNELVFFKIDFFGCPLTEAPYWTCNIYIQHVGTNNINRNYTSNSIYLNILLYNAYYNMTIKKFVKQKLRCLYFFMQNSIFLTCIGDQPNMRTRNIDTYTTIKMMRI